MSLFVVAESKKFNKLYISEQVWNDRVCKFLFAKGFNFRIISEKNLEKEGFVILSFVCNTRVVVHPKIHTVNYLPLCMV